MQKTVFQNPLILKLNYSHLPALVCSISLEMLYWEWSLDGCIRKQHSLQPQLAVSVSPHYEQHQQQPSFVVTSRLW